MPTIKTIYSLARRSGTSFLLHILLNTWRTNYLNRKYFHKRKGAQNLFEHVPQRLSEVEEQVSGARFNFSTAELTVRFLSEDVLHLLWAPGKVLPPYAIAQSHWLPVDVELKREGDIWKLSSREVTLEVHAHGELRFCQPNGALLRREVPPRYGGLASNPGWSTCALLQPDEGIFGLGEQTEGLNLRGSRHVIWNKDPAGSYAPGKDPIYMPLPVYLSLSSAGGYYIFYHNSHPAQIDIDPVVEGETNTPSSIRVNFEGGALDYYFILGDPRHGLKKFSELTGKPCLPPLWSLGYHQSRWGYCSQEDILEVLEGFLRQDMPLSAIHLDIDYMRGYRVFTVDKTRFSDLKSLAQRLAAVGVKLVCILDPGVKRDAHYAVYQEGKHMRAFCTLSNGQEFAGVVWPGTSAFPDFTNEEVRQWWGSHYPALVEQGVAGFWHDMNEPTSFSLLGQNTLPFEVQHHMEGQKSDHREAHNLYALMMNRAGFEALQACAPQRRPWILSRSGWVSQQRYAWKWTGDCESSWKSLRATLPNIMGMGLSGIPFNGVDIGGFSGDPSPELYLRWFQMATFLPLFRTHSAIGTKRREPWVFGEPYTSVIRRYLKFRYALMPYLYTLAWECCQTGWPMVRPMFWEHPEQMEYWYIEDQFFLGDALLVAPILAQGEVGRFVSLPEGRWCDLWKPQIYPGPARVEVRSGLEDIPVFVRAGCVLPLQHGERLTLRVFPPEEDQIHLSQLYLDDGDGYEGFHLSQFEIRRDEQGVRVHWQSQGTLPFPYPLVEFDLRALSPTGVILQGQRIPLENGCITVAPFDELWIKEG